MRCLPNVTLTDLQHKIWIIMLDGELCLSPINETGNALEIGSGTGIWAIEFARKYPHSTVSHVILALNLKYVAINDAIR